MLAVLSWNRFVLRVLDVFVNAGIVKVVKSSLYNNRVHREKCICRKRYIDIYRDRDRVDHTHLVCSSY